MISSYSYSRVFIGLYSSKSCTNLSLRTLVWMVVAWLVDFPVSWKPFWLLWSHDRKIRYANEVGQNRSSSKKWAKNGTSALKNGGSARKWPHFWQFWLITKYSDLAQSETYSHWIYRLPKYWRISSQPVSFLCYTTVASTPGC